MRKAYSGNHDLHYCFHISKVIRMNSHTRSALAVAQRRLVISHSNNKDIISKVTFLSFRQIKYLFMGGSLATIV